MLRRPLRRQDNFFVRRFFKFPVDVRRIVCDTLSIARGNNTMARYRECPSCGDDISDSYVSYDPDVGIMSGGWYCDRCDVAVAEEDEYDWDGYE